MNVTSKLSLYDFLTMFVSGSLILACIMPASVLSDKQCCCRASDFDFLIPLFFSLAAYLVGMIWHKLVEWFWSIIFKSKKKCIFGNVFRSFERNSKKLISVAFEEVAGYPKSVIKDTDECRQRKYYFGYYYLQEKQSLGNIPILEAQEALLRDILLPLLGFGVIPLFSKCYNTLAAAILSELKICHCFFFVISIIVVLILLFLHSSIQMKIYKLVWEGTHYVSRLEYMSAKHIDMRDPCICDNLPANCSKKSNSANNIDDCPCENKGKCPGCPFL